MNDPKQNKVSRRQFLGTLGVGAAASVLTACGAPSTSTSGTSGQAASNSPTPAAASSGGAGDLQFWDMVWGPPEYIDTAKKVVATYNQSNPNTKVSYQSNPWSSWPQVFTTAVGSGTPPDISTGGGYQAIQFYPQNAILELDDVVAGLKPDDFLPGQLDSVKFNGHYVALPWGTDIRIPFYRKDLFDKAGVTPPTNWDELRAGLKKLTTGNQYGIGFAGNDPSGSQGIFSLMYNNGGGFFSADGKLDIMNDRNVEAATFVSSLIKDGVVHPGSAGFAGTDLEKAFGSGGVAMIIYVPGTETRVTAALKPQVQLLSPMSGPHGDKGTMMFANNIMVYKQTKNPDATKAFLKWWSENSLPIWTEGHAGNLPARASIANDPYFQNDPFLKRILSEWVSVGKLMSTKTKGTFPALSDLDSGGQGITFGTDLLQGMDPKQALQKFETALKGLKSIQQLG